MNDIGRINASDRIIAAIDSYLDARSAWEALPAIARPEAIRAVLDAKGNARRELSDAIEAIIPDTF